LRLLWVCRRDFVDTKYRGYGEKVQREQLSPAQRRLVIISAGEIGSTCEGHICPGDISLKPPHLLMYPAWKKILNNSRQEEAQKTSNGAQK
jgi:hypothetical protein